MGEDSCRNGVADKKPTVANSHLSNGISHNMNGSAISSCSEADSESTTCFGDMDDHTMDEQDYQYGPGIVSKLRTKFLSISLKQSRCGINSMRRSCSLENILDQKSSISPTNIFSSTNRFGPALESKSSMVTSSSWSNLKRAKSMDTLLLSVAEEQRSKTVNNEICTTPEIGSERVPKVIRKKDGPLTRITTLTICDEELPKPDTVKTYKRMFEPAESKKTGTNSNVRRRPPVLRATAKSGSISNGKSTGSSNKMNGMLSNSIPPVKSNSVSTKCDQSAKESSISKDCSPKVISNPSKPECKILEENRNPVKNSVNIKKDIPVMNGLVKAEPVKFKLKDESLKRNFRVHKHIEGEKRSFKPAIPAKKPLIHPKTINSIAQILEKKSTMDKNPPPLPKQTIPKPEKLEKITLKPILAKHIDKPVNLNNNKQLECHQNTTSSEVDSPVIKPLVENGVSSVPKETTPQQNGLKEEPQPLLNGFSTSESPDPPILPEQKHSLAPKKDVPNPPVLQNGDGQRETIILKTNSVKSAKITNNHNSMVFDFRGKDVEAHLAIIPAPFGCRKAIPASSKKRSVLLDGKEPYALNGFSNGDAIGTDEDDDDFMDYSTPQPCGLVFEGENIRVGKGAILATRNKELKIQFDEDVEKNTFVYPSESSYLSDDSSSVSSSSDLSSLEDNTVKLTNGVLSSTTAKLRANTAIGSNGVGGLMSYTPSVLRTVDNFQPGIFRAPEKEDQKLKEKKDGDEGEEENRERKEQEQNGVADDSDEGSTMLKPADPEFISSWSLSTNTSDLLF